MINRIVKHADTLCRIEKELLHFGFEYNSYGYANIEMFSDEDRTSYGYTYYIDLLDKCSQMYSMVYAVKLLIHVFDDRVEIELSHKLMDKHIVMPNKITKDFLKGMINYLQGLSIDELEKSEVKENKYEDRIEQDSYVYLMKNKRNNYTKIGKSNNPKYRERTLQSQEPEVSLIFKKKVTNPSIVEKTLHDKYKDFRLRGEWFDLSKEHINEIKKYFTCDT